MRLTWLEEARRNVINLRAYIALHNPEAAKRQVEFIRQAARGLLQFPEMGPEIGMGGLRELVVGNTPYIIAYRLRSDEVQILRVLHGKQRWPEIT